MAIDFPSSGLTVGQVFQASNGGTYQWNGTFWLPVGNSSVLTTGDTPPASPTPGQLWFNSTLGQLFIWFDDGTSQQWVPANPVPMVAAGGDFFATHSITFAVPTTAGVAMFNTVNTGNSGGWYNVATGRYSPPAGRYKIFCTVTFSQTTAVANFAYLQLRKNGAVLYNNYATMDNNGWHGSASVDGVLDANGTDYFDIAMGAGVAGCNVNGGTVMFGAYPISGIKGPPGDPGTQGLPGAAGAPGPPGSTPTGDFCATLTTGTVPTSLATLIPTTIISGNSGLWYSTSTGRWIPPAGRYVIYGALSAYPGNSSNYNGFLRKNGVNIAPLTGASSGAGEQVGLSMQYTVDANGSDWFDMQALAGVAGATINVAAFGGYPISGVKGPVGDPGPGALSLYSEQVLASPGTTLTVTFPVAAKRVDLDIWYTTSPLADLTTCVLQGMSGASPVTTAAYTGMISFFRADGSSGGSFYSSATSHSINGGWAQVNGQINFQRPSAGYGKMHCHALTAGGTRYQLIHTYEGQFATGTFTGYRLICSGGNFAAGSFMRCYVVI